MTNQSPLIPKLQPSKVQFSAVSAISLACICLGLPLSANASLQTPATSTQKQLQSCPKVNDSIVIATGNSFHTQTDYQGRSFLGLKFIRYYNSITPDIDIGIGTKWRHNFAHHISSSDTSTLVYRNNGQVFAFNYNGTNWQGDVDVPDTLVETTDENNHRTGWLYSTSKDTIEQYNTAGQLTLITNHLGKTQSFVYNITTEDGGDNNDATLDKVTGFSGDTITFGYDTNAPHPERIIHMTDPKGHTHQYKYSTTGNLQSVTYPDTTPTDDTDNPTQHYYYKNITFPHQLTSITNEKGHRDISWAYDAQGRAVSSELAGGANKSTISYDTDNGVTVTNPLGKKTAYQFTVIHGVKKLTQITGHPVNNCTTGYKAYTYDANGYLASKTSRQGILTTYKHDSKGREISRTEAMGTAGAQSTTTQWHTDFNLPVKITEHDRVTEFSYDTQGRLTSQIIRSIQ